MSYRRKLYAIVALTFGCLAFLIGGITMVKPDYLSSPEDSACITLGCWTGISPGSTTLVEAQRILEIRYGHAHLTINPNNISWESQNGAVKLQRGYLSADAQGIVADVDVAFSEGQMTVDHIISKIGTPSYVYVNTPNCGGAFITYPGTGIIAWLNPENASSIGVQPTQSIGGLQLLPVEEASHWTITDHIKLPWQGYKDYTEDCKRVVNQGTLK